MTRNVERQILKLNHLLIYYQYLYTDIPKLLPFKTIFIDHITIGISNYHTIMIMMALYIFVKL